MPTETPEPQHNVRLGEGGVIPGELEALRCIAEHEVGDVYTRSLIIRTIKSCNELEDALRKLRDGCRHWASDEDGAVHYKAADAYNRASDLLGLPRLKDEGHDDGA